MNPVIISGPSGAGKSTASRLLFKAFGIPFVNVGDLLFNALDLDEAMSENRSAIGNLFLKQYGEAQIIQIIEESISGKNLIILDGVRMLSTCKHFVQKYPHTRVWFIKKSIDYSLNDDYAYQLREIEKIANIVLTNDGTIEKFRCRIIFRFFVETITHYSNLKFLFKA